MPGDATVAVHGERVVALEPRAMSTPVIDSVTFQLRAADLEGDTSSQADWWYGRISNPTVQAVAARVAALEHAESALLLNSGMSAISLVIDAWCRAGERIVAATTAYGDTVRLLRLKERLGIHVDWVDGTDGEHLEAALRTPARLVLLEAITNPALRVPDLDVIGAAAKRSGAMMVVDSTFATPLNLRPLEHGATCVVHSATKFLAGHSDLLGGVVAGPRDLVEALHDRATLLGSTLDPRRAWLLERSLKTLPLRVARHNESARTIASWLGARADVSSVRYPGLPHHPDADIARRLLKGGSALVSFCVAGQDPDRRALATLDRLRIVRHATSLGSVESLASAPTFSSHRGLNQEQRRNAGIEPGMIRLSVGVEDVADLQDDLDQALGGAA